MQKTRRFYGIYKSWVKKESCFKRNIFCILNSSIAWKQIYVLGKFDSEKLLYVIILL